MKTKRLWNVLLCFVLIAAMTFGAVACKKKNPDSDPDTPPAVTAPVVTGVANNGVYYLGRDTIIPAYDKGTGSMTKDGGEAYAFASGTAVTELGAYVLTVTLENGDTPLTTVVSFGVNEYFAEYPGEITDMFDNTRLGDGYILDEGMKTSVQDGVATFANREGGDPWSIAKRKFADVDATTNPYLEFKVDRIADGSVARLEVCLSNTEYTNDEGSVGETKIGEIIYAGVYRFDVLSWVKAQGLDASAQDIYLILKVVGKSAGYAAADIDYYRSIDVIPESEPAEALIDNTAETLATWREDTVKYEIADGVMYAFVDPGHDEGYGRMVKRVALNTKAYPYLVADIAEVAANTSWNLKISADGVDGEPSLTGDTSAVGRYEIDFSAFDTIQDREYVEVTLSFYVIGKGDDNIVGVNGFETLAESERAPALNENFANPDRWSRGGSQQEVTLAVENNRGTLTLLKNHPTSTDGYGCINLNAALNTKEYRYLVFDVVSADANYTVKLNGTALLPETKNTGKIYIDMQKAGSGFASGYNVAVVLEFYLMGDNNQTVVLSSVTTTNEAPDRSVVDDFSKADWKSDVGSSTVADNAMTLVKNANEGMGKASKTFALDTSEDHVLRFGISAMNAGWDEGFKIKVMNQTVDQWPTLTVKGDTMTKIERRDGGWDVYVDLKALADAAEDASQNLDASKFVGSVTLTFEIIVEFGDAEKSVTFDTIRLVHEVPAV